MYVAETWYGDRGRANKAKERISEVTSIMSIVSQLTLKTILICILLSASRDVHFDKRMICLL